MIALFIVGFVGRGWTRLPLTHNVRGGLRWISLLTGLVVLGFLYNRPMVIAWVSRMMSGDWPAWQTQFYFEWSRSRFRNLPESLFREVAEWSKATVLKTFRHVHHWPLT